MFCSLQYCCYSVPLETHLCYDNVTRNEHDEFIMLYEYFMYKTKHNLV